MPKSPSLSAEANALVIIASEAAARRTVSKSANIPSGALPVLALLCFRQEQGKTSRPAAVYAAKIANQALVRAYVRQLIAAQLVSLTIRRGLRWLAPTLDGLGLASKYTRAIRTGIHKIRAEYE